MTDTPHKKLLPLTVLIRIKPDKKEIEYTTNTIRMFNTKQQLVEYTFDGVFPPHSKTIEIFNTILPTLQEISGRTKHVSLLAYGQTGSGKTYTMLGTDESPGLITLVVKCLCNDGRVSVSFLEIYNEKAIDLMDNREKPLREADGTVCIQGLIEREVNTLEEFESLAQRAFSARKSAATALNERSSRSHLLIRLHTDSRMVTLVDLAGAENNRKTGNSGLRMEESLNINRSLFVLNKVVKAIAAGDKRIPYRDSKLTRLLCQSIGGSGRCFLIATIIDNHETFGEASHTLNFATSAKKIKNSEEEMIESKVSKKFIESKKFIKNKDSKSLVKNKDSKGFIKNKESKSLVKNKDSKNFIESKESKNLIENNVTIKNIKYNGNISIQNNSLTSILSNETVEMTPITKKKSYECFLAKAKEQEMQENLKGALATYKIIRKFADSELVNSRIFELQNRLKKNKKKMNPIRVLEILNSGDFFAIKQIGGIGDRRAQAVVDFIAGGNFFESLDDLRMLFSEKITRNILEFVEG